MSEGAAEAKPKKSAGKFRAYWALAALVLGLIAGAFSPHFGADVHGAVIGTAGAGGHCSGSCVHVGVRVDGQYVSPLLFFGGVPPAVLLPLGSR